MKKFNLEDENQFDIDLSDYPMFRPEQNIDIINQISDDEIELHFIKKRIDKIISDLYQKHCGLRRELRFNLDTMRGFYVLVPV